MRRDNGAAGGMTLSGTLAVIFIVLKLVGVIHWSWLWVLAPIWAPTAILAVVLFWAVCKYK
jgi:hypothetical protein